MNIDLQTKTDFTPQHRDRVDIVFYADPLCCWSWAFQPVLDRFLQVFQDDISYRQCMGGMIPDWKTFSDPFNSIDRPAQMAPLWMHVAEVTGTPINEQVWAQDPPSSSLPACLAVKSAELQSMQAGRLYLYAAQEAVMKDGLNISNGQVLAEIAARLASKYPQTFDYDTFVSDYNSPASIQALKADLEKVRYHKIGRFPTVTMTIKGRGLILTGYRPFEVLQQAFLHIAPAYADDAPAVNQDVGRK